MTGPDFWLTSGFHLLERDDDGMLHVTDEFLRAYFHRPEMAPVEESCDAERRLHASLLEAPRRPVKQAELKALADRELQPAMQPKIEVKTFEEDGDVED